MVEWFSGEYGRTYGGSSCEAILGDDPRSQDSARCPRLVLETYEKVKALLIENGFDLSARTFMTEEAGCSGDVTASVYPECLRTITAFKLVQREAGCSAQGMSEAVVGSRPLSGEVILFMNPGKDPRPRPGPGFPGQATKAVLRIAASAASIASTPAPPHRSDPAL